jgi:DNA-binding NarL/FixJ family response regulator
MSPRAAGRQSGGMQETAHSAAPLRVFVVEDSGPVRERLEVMVALTGAVVAGHASTVAAAVRAILLERPALVILDVQLADGTGFDVLRALRKQAPEIDVYLLSNFSAYPYRQLAERLGAKGFFDKSREFGAMRDVVAQRAANGH